MTQITTLSQAVAQLVHDGDTVAMEGFTHLIPFAAGHEVIRQGRRNLTLVRLTPDLLYDQLIGMGCVRKLIFSWGGNPGVGSLHRMRDAVEKHWPCALELEEYSHAALSCAFAAGAANLPFGVLRGFMGVDLPRVNENIRQVECPFTGQKLAAVRAMNPDVAIVHAQKADKKGNILFEGIVGVQKHCVMAAKRSLVTVEEIVDVLEPAGPNAVVLPRGVATCIAHAPRGAFPSYALGYYPRSNSFYKAWDTIARDRAHFTQWMEEHVMQQPSQTTSGVDATKTTASGE